MAQPSAKYTLLATDPSEHARSYGADYGRNRLDARLSREIEEEVDAHTGALAAGAAESLEGRFSRWVLFCSIGAASFIYSLDASTTNAYLAFAASTFSGHNLISTIQVVQSLIIAVGKPVIAKIADVSSRATAFLVVLICYVFGYLIIASAPNVGTIAGGIISYAVGFTGLQLLTQIIIADLTSLKWRALVSSLVTFPFVISGFLGPNIANFVLKNLGWRWGYAMFAILVPLAVVPLIVVLFWAERKAKRISPSGERPGSPNGDDWSKKFKIAAVQLDLVGLVLLGAAVSLILLPLTLVRKSSNGSAVWGSGSLLILLILGLVVLGAFAVWDLRYASRPVIAPRFMKNRSVVLASVIGFFDFMSFFLTFTYLYTFVLIVKPWTLLEATYFIQVQSVALTIFGMLAGVSMALFRRYKYVLIVGLIVRIIGIALMIHSRGPNGLNAELVWTQILQGVGGGAATTAAQVGAQASIPHIDVAMVTAVVLLVTEMGGAIGSATAGAIWSTMMPDKLAEYLPFLGEEERQVLFGDINKVIEIPRGDPVREGVIRACDDTMMAMVVLATVLSMIPVVCSLFMPNWYLGDQQNAVEVDTRHGELEIESDAEDDQSD